MSNGMESPGAHDGSSQRLEKLSMDSDPGREKKPPAAVPSAHKPSLDRFVLKQVAAALVFSQVFTCVGAAVGFTSVFITQETSGEHVYLSRVEITWTISSLFIGVVCGNLLSGVLTPILGYRRLVQVAAPVSIVSWLMLSLCYEFPLLVISRAVIGLTIGTTDSAARAYISEVSAEWIRGALGLLPSLVMGLNMMVVYALSSQMSWRYALLVAGVAPTFLQLIATFALPDAAKWMLTHGKSPQRARSSIMYYRGCSKTADAEVASILSNQKHDLKSSAPLHARVAAIFMTSQHRRPFVLLLFQLFLFTFSGGEALSNYMTEIFAAAGAGENIYMNAIISSGLRIVGSAASVLLIERAGRIPLLQFATLLQVAGCLGVGFFFHYRSSLADHGWLLLLGIMVINFSYSMGSAPIWVLFSELPCSSVRSESLNLLLFWFGVLMFSFVHISMALVRATGYQGLFWSLGGLGLVQIAFAQWCLPETKGLSLEEIQRRFFAPKSVPDMAEASEGRALFDANARAKTSDNASSQALDEKNTVNGAVIEMENVPLTIDI